MSRARPSSPSRATSASTGGHVEADAGVADRVYGFLRAIPASFLWIIVIIWSLPTLGLFVSSFRTREAQTLDRVVDGHRRLDDLTLDNYRTVLESSAHGVADGVAAQLVRHRHPGDDHPDRHRRLRRLRLRLDRLQGPQAAVHRHGRRCWRSRCRWRCIPLLQMYVGGAHLTIPFLDKTITLVPDLDLAGTTTAVWLTHAGFAMPFAIFLLHNYISAAAQGPVRGGADRRRRPLHDLLAARAPAVGARCWRRSPSSSSCGRGTTT